MVHIQILDMYHSPILSRPLFQWPLLKSILFLCNGFLYFHIEINGGTYHQQA